MEKQGITVANIAIMEYDGNMDTECVALCDALNSLPGVGTFESCCGHGQRPYSVWLKTTDPYSLAVLARAVDRRYLHSQQMWSLTLETCEVEGGPMFCVRLSSERPYEDGSDMLSDVAGVISSIRYWAGDEFKKHFGKKEETCEGCVNFKGCVTCVDHDQKRTLG